MIPDQKQLWDKKHGEGEHEDFRYDSSPFARVANDYFPVKAKVLELGCGVGRDAVYFAAQDHLVVATDFSEVIIGRDRETFPGSGVQFEVLDMEKPFPYPDRTFDAVYANLALHYYSDRKTREIMREITRVLAYGGVLAFACKSIHDPHYGNGEEVENNFFISATGHVRHLFTKEYAQDILGTSYEVMHLAEVEEVYSGQKSGMIQCVARRVHDGR